jgi:hypothetical protein
MAPIFYHSPAFGLAYEQVEYAMELGAASRRTASQANDASSIVSAPGDDGLSLLAILLGIILLSFLLALGFLAMRIAFSLAKHALLVALVGLQLATRQARIVYAHARSHGHAQARRSLLSLSNFVSQASQLASQALFNKDTALQSANATKLQLRQP